MNIEEFSNELGNAIYKQFEAQDNRQSNRLGGSIIGDNCERKIWYMFRWAKKPDFDGRMRKLFNTGHIHEDRIVNTLRDAGYSVENTQKEYTACYGHFVSKPDGEIDDKYSLEIKTHNEKNFKKLKKEIPRKHIIQGNINAYFMGAKKWWYVAENKNDDTIYSQKIETNAKMGENTLFKAQRIIDARTPPAGVDNFTCKFCPLKSICKDGEPMDVNCRTCVHARTVTGGKWECAAGNNFGEACGDYKPPMVSE